MNIKKLPFSGNFFVNFMDIEANIEIFDIIHEGNKIVNTKLNRCKGV